MVPFERVLEGWRAEASWLAVKELKVSYQNVGSV